jgi:hypothetical protein
MFAANEAAVVRLVGALRLEQNDEWAVRPLHEFGNHRWFTDTVSHCISSSIAWLEDLKI